MIRDDLRACDILLIWLLFLVSSAPLFHMAFADHCASTGAEMVDGKICTLPLAWDKN